MSVIYKRLRASIAFNDAADPRELCLDAKCPRAAFPNLSQDEARSLWALSLSEPSSLPRSRMQDYYLPGVHAEELLVAADFGDALRVKALVEKGAATLPHQLRRALVPRSPFA